jgi:hypothetical protein
VKYTACCFLFLCAGGAVSAQTAEEIDRLLVQHSVRWGEASVWTFASAGEPYAERDAAFYAIHFKAMPKDAALDTPIDLEGLALLVMRVYKLQGGLFYTLFKNRRYAFREMVYSGIYQQGDDPHDTISGARFMHILSRISTMTNGE